MINRHRLYCHECDGYIIVDIDDKLNGNHVIVCPKCQHEHCRVVRDGQITDTRWDQRNGCTYRYNPLLSGWTSSASIVNNIYTSAWLNSTMNTTTTSSVLTC